MLRFVGPTNPFKHLRLLYLGWCGIQPDLRDQSQLVSCSTPQEIPTTLVYKGPSGPSVINK